MSSLKCTTIDASRVKQHNHRLVENYINQRLFSAGLENQD